MDELVERLSTGQHPVEITIRPERTLQAVKAKIESGYIHIKFTNTRGGTELGVALDTQLTDLSGGNLQSQEGAITLVGDLTLNYEKVRCIANIDLQTFTGTGRLEPRPA